MITLDRSIYRGEITCQNKHYIFRAAMPEDAGELAKMYLKIAIHGENYRKRFDPLGRDNFEKIGGMFVIHNEDSIRKELSRDNSYFAIIKEVGGQIVAFLWVSCSDPSFTGVDLALHCPLSNEWQGDIESAMGKGGIFFPREIVVSPSYRYKGMAELLCFTVFTAAKANGYTVSLGEVYKVCAYHADNADAEVEVNMLNECGFQTVLGMGGRFIGVFPQREIQVGELKVLIESQIFILSYNEILPILEQTINQYGATVKWESVTLQKTLKHEVTI